MNDRRPDYIGRFLLFFLVVVVVVAVDESPVVGVDMVGSVDGVVGVIVESGVVVDGVDMVESGAVEPGDIEPGDAGPVIGPVLGFVVVGPVVVGDAGEVVWASAAVERVIAAIAVKVAIRMGQSFWVTTIDWVWLNNAFVSFRSLSSSLTLNSLPPFNHIAPDGAACGRPAPARPSPRLPGHRGSRRMDRAGPWS